MSGKYKVKISGFCVGEEENGREGENGIWEEHTGRC